MLAEAGIHLSDYPAGRVGPGLGRDDESDAW